jgi:hypothetical protein
MLLANAWMPNKGSGVFFELSPSIMEERVSKKAPGPFLVALLASAAIVSAGCTTTPAQYWERLKGDGFPGWSEAMGSGVRGNKDAKSSGFFTDRRSEQIEKDLGGF